MLRICKIFFNLISYVLFEKCGFQNSESTHRCCIPVMKYGFIVYSIKVLPAFINF